MVQGLPAKLQQAGHQAGLPACPCECSQEPLAADFLLRWGQTLGLHTPT